MSNTTDKFSPQESENADESSRVLATVLHSLRNGISPIAVGLDLILNELNQVSTANIQRALQELHDDNTSNERKEALAKYIFLATEKLTEVVESAKEQVTNQTSHLSDVEKILSKKHKPTDNQSPEGALKFYKMVDAALNLMAKELRSQTEIDIDSGLANCPAAKAERFLLIKVLVNVLNNAAQSTIQAERNPGQILIRAQMEEENGTKFLHAEIEDNGGGISSERAEEIFVDTGDGPPARLSPNGLRWSADAMRKMNGTIYMRSPGEGKGATVHMILPLAPEGLLDAQEKAKEEKASNDE